METVLIVIHLMVVLALVGVVLLQRSEGGGLGIGGGSGFMTARGAANALTRATAILAAAFFVTSLALSILARYGEKPTDILNRAPASGVLNQLPGANGPVGGTAPAAPSGGTTTTTPLSNGAATTAPATAPVTPAPANPATPPAANGVTLPVTPQVPNQ
ncbi:MULTISPECIES: preprotein translocase subunit SecG [unclassified Mesorhizobium]|uniref:preprotein translocase subunit SecG n=1 Tax=unclassified Mesorhizobium TaxID=325217 RepID=UPI000F759F1D|nr:MULTISPECIES: preprotein translocase subunit SecG [unclassified Mesorhizobium]AZO23778.1 preprotein translocase subunit SecG [Mesorhizobium sp. M1E.F.Ca.ET.045.02.1.1]RUW23566.1 preprotein translocase subunit SecG [Mesorhizobium sp. M1E.F.Ca.ET.041.01.1.1]RWD92443.1 MAG: preprotein translocase subunit SecG [Mesorhizobium sp.]RWD94448.1 MAG: preprotein translocase subunit SecG [Mesorhizobium sp.]TIV52254.1 MAG: preprotein translocase subunit SecG [Mesorhizobium sp.]